MSSSNKQGISEKNGTTVSRRNFLKVIGAAGGAAATGCARQPVEKIIPYLNQPNEVVPGVASWYTGTCGECQAGCGVLVRTREGRVVKVEGNPSSPINEGGLCALGQSTLQTLYDPDRVREPLFRKPGGAFSALSWEDAIGKLSSAVKEIPSGKEVVILTAPLSGSAKKLVGEFGAAFPGVRHAEYSFSGQHAVDSAAEAVFGSGYRTHFDFSKADVIVSFGSGFLETWISPARFSKQWSSTRRVDRANGVSYVVQVEPRLSLTAANADRWINNAPNSEAELLRGLLKLIVDKRGSSDISGGAAAAVSKAVEGVDADKCAHLGGISPAELDALAHQLAHASRSLVVAGGASISGQNELACGVLANLINVVLGNVGSTVMLEHRDSANALTMAELIAKMSAGEVAALVISGSNPFYTLPTSSGFREALVKVPLIAVLAANLDETASQAQLVLPASTNFESWGDSVPLPGVHNLNQPAMQPLYETASLGDLLISTAGRAGKLFEKSRNFYDYIRAQWKQRVGAADFENRWLKFVEAGGDFAVQDLTANKPAVLASAGDVAAKTQKRATGIHMLAFPTVRSADGSSANRPWMQEVPDPLTTVVWDTWVEIHPELAEQYHLSNGDVAMIKTDGGVVRTPVFLTNKIHKDVVAVPIGGGHDRMGRFANGVGVNVLSILPYAAAAGGASLLQAGVSLNKDPEKEKLVVSQGSDDQLERGIIRWVSADDLHHQHGIHQSAGHGEGHEEPKQMYKQMEHPLYRWAMTIDLASCTGCTACVVACYAENNVPVVGKELAREGREMSWIRISRYFNNDESRPVDGFLPMMCQHCNNAPCEPVCPVYATYHSEEGLNHMVYNRCVGTRYCSNNCSYKVRRFNWFKYDWPEPMNWQLNPDVTVREVGVMEKCTFCVQRIREAQNNAKNDGRPVADGEINPACASSCPTNAITFGNQLDEQSAVSKLAHDVRAYKVLDAHLNTQPAISYLARLVHPEAAKASAASGGSHGDSHGGSEHH
ncbi:MAG: 4Fe-4S dicluster domain-containing protein [Bdellovibrionales bacterium]|nr:4Fe-4S dicluster domain-containing protein [Bdellovibrionales bacterium]